MSNEITKMDRTRRGSALAKTDNAWGLPTNDPSARTALAALTAYYGLDPILGDCTILGGKTLYITEAAYKKKLDELSVSRFNGRLFKWTKRPATKDEIESLGYKKPGARVWYVELYEPGSNVCVTSAYGEADTSNCTLQNVGKESGDPRTLNRMAIKRAQHECMRDVVSFRLPAQDEFEKKLGISMDQMMSSGVTVVADDGITPIETFEEQAEDNKEHVQNTMASKVVEVNMVEPEAQPEQEITADDDF